MHIIYDDVAIQLLWVNSKNEHIMMITSSTVTTSVFCRRSIHSPHRHHINDFIRSSLYSSLLLMRLHSSSNYNFLRVFTDFVYMAIMLIAMPLNQFHRFFFNVMEKCAFPFCFRIFNKQQKIVACTKLSS